MKQRPAPDSLRRGHTQKPACEGGVGFSAFSAQVEGRVQGVGFRYSCIHEGRRLGLTGWVRNTPSGDVEVWAEGSAGRLETLLQWLHQGPPGARVEAVRHHEGVPTGKYRDFGLEY